MRSPHPANLMLPVILKSVAPGTAIARLIPDLLRTRYEKAAEFRSRRILGRATLGEAGAPHDWKYTHAAMSLYRRLR
jgi:hypothetical protein